MTPTQHPEPAEVVGLTEGEKIALRNTIRDVIGRSYGFDAICRQVERILDDRLAAVQAERDTAHREADDLRARLGAVEVLADEWNGYPGGGPSLTSAADDLRAALANPSATEDEADTP